MLTLAAYHEAAHRLRIMDESSYQTIRDMVLTSLREDLSAEEYKALYDQRAEAYGNDADAVEEEIVAQFLGTGKAVLENERVAAAVSQNPTVWQKFVSALKRVVAEIREAIKTLAKTDRTVAAALKTEETKLQGIVDAFDTLLAKATQEQAAKTENKQKEIPAGEGGEKYSIAIDEQGKYVSIDTDQQIFEGKTTKEIRYIARKLIKEKFGDKVLNVGENDKAYIPKSAGKEYVFPAKHNMDEQILESKYKTSPELNNLLSISIYEGHFSDDGNHPEAIGGWDYYKTRFEIGGLHFSGTVKIMITKKGRKFHDITQIKIEESHRIDQSDKKSDAYMENLYKYNSTMESKNQEEKFSIDLEAEIEKAREAGNQIDVDYLTAVRDGDMDTAQRLVARAAKRAGYDSPKLYHGTAAFGFTEFDLEKGDKLIFAANKPEIAETYVGETNRRDIADRSRLNVDAMDPEDLLENANKHLDGRYKGYRVLSEDEKRTLKDENQREMQGIAEQIYDFLSDNAGAFDEKKESLVRSMARHVGEMALANTEDELQEEYNGYHADSWDFKWRDESYSDELTQLVNRRINEAFEKAHNLFYKGTIYQNGESLVFDNQIALELDADLHKGIYQLFGKMGTAFDFDAEGTNWNQIKLPKFPYTTENTEFKETEDAFILINQRNGKELHSVQKNENNKQWTKESIWFLLINTANFKQQVKYEGPQTTREVAEWAFDNGYDSVVIRNLRDVSDATDYRGTGDIYIFNAKNGVKSADTVTYDDEGNIIPLSERFDEKNTDIRYSIDMEAEAERKLDEDAEGDERITAAQDVLRRTAAATMRLASSSEEQLNLLVPKTGAVKKITDNFNFSDGNAKELAGTVQKMLYNLLSGRVSFAGYMQDVTNLMRDEVENAGHWEELNDSSISDFKKQYRNTGIYLAPDIMATVAETFGGRKALRNATLGKINQ